MATVYVVQEPKMGRDKYTYDISPAMPFGAITFVFKANEQPSLSPGPSMFRARHILKDFCDNDYILWAGGDPAALAIATCAAADINRGRYKFLRWERERITGGIRTGRGFYMPVEISLRG
jgi:hypothetical protein